MKRLIFRLNILIFMLAFSAGLIFFACAFMGGLPKGVTINGTPVGGKNPAEAAKIIRAGIEEELKGKSLTVRGQNAEYVFTYPEISYKDNLQTLLKQVRRGGSYTAEVKYYLNGIYEVAENICGSENLERIEPYYVFNKSGAPFEYFEGQDGIKADKIKLISDVRASLEAGFGGGKFSDVTVGVKAVNRTRTLNEVKYYTRKLSTYITYFDSTNTDRVHNIKLAAESINGTVLNNGDSFSFNQTVGARTAERGYRTAKIIENGEFVEGTGGGVCQVSTTLFNAALRAGCAMTEFHSHSLAVSYVPPSCDAMVSGDYYDLKFSNSTGYTLYIRARTGKSYVAFDVYGRGDGAQYEFSSVVTQSIAAPEEVTDDITRVRDGKDGIVSEGYITVIRNGIKTTRLFRRDKYAPMKRVVLEEVIDKSEE